MAKGHPPLRKDSFDMQRSVVSKFDPLPAPTPVSTQRFEPHGDQKGADPLMDHLHGIRDTTGKKS